MPVFCQGSGCLSVPYLGCALWVGYLLPVPSTPLSCPAGTTGAHPALRDSGGAQKDGIRGAPDPAARG